MRRIRLLACLTLLPWTAGCGLIFGGTRQIISVHSSPAGATLITEPRAVTYATPVSLNLERNRNYVLTFSMDGYQPAEVELQRVIRRGIVVLDVVLGVVPVIVDAATGAWYRLRPQDVSVSLEPLEAGSGLTAVDLRLSKSLAANAAVVLVESAMPGVKVTVDVR